MGITKTDYMRGMQCPRMLWLDKHRPEYKVIPPEVKEKLDAGNEFGDKAMGLLGPFVEVTTLKENGMLDYSQMVEKTKACLSFGEVNICEASFSFYGNFCAVDILHKVDDGFEIYEVKNCPRVEEQFVKDVGFQRYILLKCGLKIKACYIVYHGEDESDPYVIEDVTSRAKSYSYEVDDNIWRLGKIKFQKEEVFIEPSEHCEKPYRCWYWDYCHNSEEK